MSLYTPYTPSVLHLINQRILSIEREIYHLKKLRYEFLEFAMEKEKNSKEAEGAGEQDGI